jgi:phage-related protein
LDEFAVRQVLRVLFFVYKGQMILLHGFIKKTQQTPNADLELAVRRMKEVDRG